MTAEQPRLHCVAVPAHTADQIRLHTACSFDWSLTWAATLAGLPHCDALVLPVEMFAELQNGRSILVHTVQVVPFGPARLLAAALGQGATDYLKFPWDAEELFARLERRFAAVSAVPELPGLVLWRNRLRTATASVRLSPAQVRIMRLLMRFAGETVGRRALYFAIWGHEGEDSRVVDVHISALRRQLRALDPGCDGIGIRTVRGEGYMLDAADRPVDKL